MCRHPVRRQQLGDVQLRGELSTGSERELMILQHHGSERFRAAACLGRRQLRDLDDVGVTRADRAEHGAIGMLAGLIAHNGDILAIGAIVTTIGLVIYLF